MGKVAGARKIRDLIEEFYEISKIRFRDNFGTRLHEFDPHEKDVVRGLNCATVVTIKRKKTGKRCMVVSYITLRGFKEKVEQIRSKIFSHIMRYFERLLHEYAEVFLFHNELLNLPTAEAKYFQVDKENICNRFAKAILKSTDHHS